MNASDLQLRLHVEQELLWDPSLPAATLGVSVVDAVVTLAGAVDSLVQKYAASELVSHMRGVRAVDNELEVRLPSGCERSDTDIAHAIASVFSWNAIVPRGCIRADVMQGWVTLEGSVDWQFQRLAAEVAVRGLMGVKGITDSITVHPGSVPRNAKAKIQAALARQAVDTMRNVCIVVDDTTVLLSGPVFSPALRDAVEQVAWKTPGIQRVQNELEVEPLDVIAFAELM